MPIRETATPKHEAELAFWRSRFEIDHVYFTNSHYRRIMLAMAGETGDDFLRGKVVGDFGCGPRGSLVWASVGALRVGIDVLADRYADAFPASVIAHDMVYVTATERVIPLPSSFFDVLFTLNAMDHVDDFAAMCSEILRVLKPAGDFIGSFNLEEPATTFEPQHLTEALVEQHLLRHLDVTSYRCATPGPADDEYANLIENRLTYRSGEPGYLWVRGCKKVPARC